MYQIHSYILHASCFRIYIEIHIKYKKIYAIDSKKKRICVIFARTMRTLINIMQMYRCYVSFIIESMNAEIYYY